MVDEPPDCDGDDCSTCEAERAARDVSENYLTCDTCGRRESLPFAPDDRCPLCHEYGTLREEVKPPPDAGRPGQALSDEELVAAYWSEEIVDSDEGAAHRKGLRMVAELAIAWSRANPSPPASLALTGEEALAALLETRWNPNGGIGEWVSSTAEGRNYGHVMRAIDALRKLTARAGSEGK